MRDVTKDKTTKTWVTLTKPDLVWQKGRGNGETKEREKYSEINAKKIILKQCLDWRKVTQYREDVDFNVIKRRLKIERETNCSSSQYPSIQTVKERAMILKATKKKCHDEEN